MKTTFTVKGTHCPSCKLLIEDVCNDIAGVRSCTANYETGSVEIEHDAALDVGKIKKEIEGLGQYHIDPDSITQA